MPQTRLRNFVFTLHADEEGEFPLTREAILENPAYSYCIIGLEAGDEKKTPHYQGYCELKKQTRFGTVKAMFHRTVHLEARKGSASQAAEYCKKEGDYLESGEISSPGKRTDISRLRDAVISGDVSNMYQAFMFSDTTFRYTNSVSTFLQLHKRHTLAPTNPVLRTWQSELMTLVTGPADPRKVLWYWDRTGNTGKTFMANYLVRNHNAYYCNGGKHSDIAYSYRSQPIAVFDFTRSQSERVPYPVIEALKNGMLFSGKYTSGLKIFDVPHVVCFANFEPDRTALSADRWDVHELVTPGN